jgi:hypothetical protein
MKDAKVAISIIPAMKAEEVTITILAMKVEVAKKNNFR